MRKTTLAMPACLCGLLAVGLLSASGCSSQVYRYTSPIRPFGGFIYSSYSVPLTTDFSNTQAAPKRTGKASSMIFVIPLRLVGGPDLDFAFGDCSVKKAAESGGISKLGYADMKYTQVLGVVGWYETIARGE